MTNAFDLLFLGTCACDFTDKLETEFKDKFDKNERRASSLLINDHFLVDSGMHILDSLRIAKIPKEQITDIFITHLHEDHFDIENIIKIASSKTTPINLWVKQGVTLPKLENVLIKEMSPYTKYKVKDELYITGLDANHDKTAYPQHFVLESKGKKLFYGCDGAWLLSDAYNYLKGANLDIAILDCTIGDYEGDYRIFEHNSIPTIRLMLPTLKNENIINKETKIILSHIAPSLHRPHNETESIAKSFNAQVAYDGMELSI